ncbi:MAG: ferritin-like domain-containing protein [Sporichthyaceae bacterium]
MAEKKDIQAVQTAASIENLAVAVYTTAATLPFISKGNKVVAAFIDKTAEQHREQAKLFNDAAVEAGGKKQTKPNPKYAKVVDAALPKIKGPLDVVALAITLEDVAAQTFVANVSEVSTPELRTLFGSIAPVHAQNRAVLLAVQALVKGDAADLVALPTKPAKLPKAAGSVGFPDGFYPTAKASPVAEGAL